MKDMRDRVSAVLEDLYSDITLFVRDNNLSFLDPINRYIDLLEGYLSGNVPFAEISPLLLDLCEMRYDLLKLIERENNLRLAIFSIKGLWVTFNINGTSEMAKMSWAKLRRVAELQDKDFEELADTYCRPEKEKQKEIKQAMDKLKQLFKNPKKFEFRYNSDILVLDEISINMNGEFSLASWNAKYIEQAPKDITEKVKKFYFAYHPTGKTLN